MINPSTQSEYYQILKDHGFVAGAKYVDTNGMERNIPIFMYDSPNFDFYIVFDNQRHIHPYVFVENIGFKPQKKWMNTSIFTEYLSHD